MNPVAFTQVLTPSMSVGSGVSEMTMSVGVPTAGARVGVTPTTTARRPGKTRSEGIVRKLGIFGKVMDETDKSKRKGSFFSFSFIQHLSVLIIVLLLS